MWGVRSARNRRRCADRALSVLGAAAVTRRREPRRRTPAAHAGGGSPRVPSHHRHRALLPAVVQGRGSEPGGATAGEAQPLLSCWVQWWMALQRKNRADVCLDVSPTWRHQQGCNDTYGLDTWGRSLSPASAPTLTQGSEAVWVSSHTLRGRLCQRLRASASQAPNSVEKGGAKEEISLKQE